MEREEIGDEDFLEAYDALVDLVHRGAGEIPDAMRDTFEEGVCFNGFPFADDVLDYLADGRLIEPDNLPDLEDEEERMLRFLPAERIESILEGGPATEDEYRAFLRIWLKDAWQSSDVEFDPHYLGWCVARLEHSDGRTAAVSVTMDGGEDFEILGYYRDLAAAMRPLEAMGLIEYNNDDFELPGPEVIEPFLDRAVEHWRREQERK